MTSKENGQSQRSWFLEEGFGGKDLGKRMTVWALQDAGRVIMTFMEKNMRLKGNEWFTLSLDIDEGWGGRERGFMAYLESENPRGLNEEETLDLSVTLGNKLDECGLKELSDENVRRLTKALNATFSKRRTLDEKEEVFDELLIKGMGRKAYNQMRASEERAVLDSESSEGAPRQKRKI